MGEEFHDYGGLRLKNNDDNLTNNKQENANTKEKTSSSGTRFNYNAYDGENLHLENNMYFQPDEPEKSVSQHGKTYKKYMGGGLPNWSFIFCVLGCVIILFLQIHYLQTDVTNKRILKDGHTVEALVTDVDHHYRSRGSDSYKVYVSFAVEGVEYHNVYLYTAHSYRSAGGYETIYYDAGNPRNITSKQELRQTQITIWMMWAILAAMGFATYRAYVDPEGFAKAMRPKRRRW